MGRLQTIGLGVALIALLGAFLALLQSDRTAVSESEQRAAAAKEAAAPEDLRVHRNDFLAGLAALQRQDGRAAVRHLNGFTLEGRAVEQYRLYYLAKAYEMSGDAEEAHDLRARLWRNGATLAHTNEVGLTVGGGYAARGVPARAADVYAGVAVRALEPPVRSSAQAQFIVNKFHQGDPAAMLFAARNTLIDTPQGELSGSAAEIVRSLSGLKSDAPVVFSVAERIRRAENLIRDGAPSAAVNELRDLNAAAAGPLQHQVLLLRGIAYHQLRQFEQSDRTLQPLFSGPFKYAEPALLHSAKNNRIIAASIDPTVIKTVTEKKRVGTRRVKLKSGKVVRRPTYRTVKKTVKLIDLAKKQKKEEHERRHSERLKDILRIRSSPAGRREALARLVELATAKKQTGYLREIAPELAKLDPLSEPALQYFWDNAWAAYERRDVTTARDLLTFISQTYANPNIRRQATYWLARTLERAGEKEQANALLQQLVDAPYDDLYAVNAKRRGIKPRQVAFTDPFRPDKPDWPEMAERQMPPELRLAYELTALGDTRAARLEIQRNQNDSNRRFADAILGDLYASEGATILAHRYMRRAFPKLATVEQNDVPPHFLRAYYPLKFEEEIREAAADRKLDPFLVMALVHQESAFQPEIRSRAGAIGLMQLMPSTGRELGSRLYQSFSEARLKNPEVNLKLGTTYLRTLLNQTGGVVEFALAGYNAGPGNLRKWRRAAPNRPLDEFVESIPYSETRGYIKRITLLRSSYERLHESLSRVQRPASDVEMIGAADAGRRTGNAGL